MSSVAATSRVYVELLKRAEQDTTVPDLWVIKPLPPIRELASAAGTTRELVSNALNQLYPSGLIRRKGNYLVSPGPPTAPYLRNWLVPRPPRGSEH